MKNTIVSILKHVYTIHLPTPLFYKEGLKKVNDPAYQTKFAPSFETLVLHPGITNVTDEQLLRLHTSRVFKGLLAGNKISINDSAREDAYNLSVNPHFKNTPAYLESQKYLALEKQNGSLKEAMGSLTAQVEELKNLLLSKKDGLVKNKKDSVKAVENDNTGDNQGKVPGI